VIGSVVTGLFRVAVAVAVAAFAVTAVVGGARRR